MCKPFTLILSFIFLVFGCGDVQPAISLPTSHVVLEGETLTSLARKYYDGRDGTWKEIYKANIKQLPNPSDIKAGQIIVIPELSDKNEILDFPPAAAPPTSHVVRKGDSLSSLARKYYDGRSGMWREIHNANFDQLPDPAEIKEGQVLFIPKLDDDGEDLDLVEEMPLH